MPSAAMPWASWNGACYLSCFLQRAGYPIASLRELIHIGEINDSAYLFYAFHGRLWSLRDPAKGSWSLQHAFVSASRPEY
jgi:hypothetical protein